MPVAPEGTIDLPVAYAGEPGAFAEDAVIAAFGDVERTPLGSFREVFEAVADGRAPAGVVPIENVINGTVRENYDLLLEFDLQIRGEVVVPVSLCLAALPGQRIEDIERVYSHIQALGQAEAFLRARPWQLLTTYNTAGAGKAIADRGERGAAAVLSPRAAALFDLEILADDIGDLDGNRTRFLILALPGGPALRLLPQGDGRRTTLVVAVRNEPGTLLAVLRVFADHGLNMHKLESRPSRERAWEYVFWIDLDADTADPVDGRGVRGARGRDDDGSGPRQLSGGAGPLSGRRGRTRVRPERLRSSSRISVSKVSSAVGPGGGSSLMNIFAMTYTTSITTMKTISELMNRPQPIAISLPSLSVPRTVLIEAKSTPFSSVADRRHDDRVDERRDDGTRARRR